MAADNQNLIEETIQLTASDGVSIAGFRARPAAGSKGGVIVLQEIFGLTDQMKSVVRFYASKGYDAIFPCFYDRLEKGLTVAFSDPDRGRELAYNLDQDKVVLDVAAAADALSAPDGVSVVGFCWGGGVMVRACADVSLKGGVAFYGTRLDTFLAHEPKCPVLLHFGTTDPNSPPDLIDRVIKRYPAAEVHLYEAGHAFANDARPTHVPGAANLAIDRTLEFLAKVHAG